MTEPDIPSRDDSTAGEPPGDCKVARTAHVSRSLGLVAAAIGALAIIGWALDFGLLKSIIPGQVEMKPNAAIGLILLGVALSLATASRAVAARLSGRLALLSAAIGAATLAENATGRDFGIDQLLFKEAPNAVGTVVPGRMASATALCLVLLGLALLLVRGERSIVIAQVLAALAGTVALFDLLAVAYGAKGATAANPFTIPAINTSAALLLIASGTLLARANRGLMAVATADASGGRLIRRVVPATAAVLVIALALIHLAFDAGYFGHDIAAAVSATAAIAALTVIAWIVASSLNARELEQRADEARLRSVLNSAGDGILTVDASGRIRMSNPMAELIFGYQPGELEGLALEELVPERFRHVHLAHRADFEAGAYGHTTGTQVTGLRKDGSEFPGEFTLARLELPGETQTTAIVRDVTESKEAERALRESEERFRALVNQIPGVTLIEVEDTAASSGFRTEFVSLQIFDLLGYTQEEWAEDQEIWLKVTHPDDRQALWEAGERALETGEPYRIDLRAVDKAGNFHWITVDSFRSDRENESRWYGLVTDISDRKRVETLEREKDAAIRASEMKSEFLSRMSHELRTPLNAILGFAQLLEMDELDEDAHESTDHILRAGRHLLELIDEVLAISQVEDDARLDMGSVDVSAICRETAEMQRAEADERGITVAVDGQEKVVGLADRIALRRSLLNLISNAIKYNRDEGRVDVRVSRIPDGRARIEISDTGKGIPAERIPRLFSPFDRLGAERTDVEGTGLGLALAKGLVEAMGGTLSVESREGEGSVFSIELQPVL